VVGAGVWVWQLVFPSQVVLPFGGLDHPSGVAVDAAGAVYASFGQLLKLPAGASSPTVLPVNGESFAVSPTGDLYLTSGHGQVLRLATGATTPTVLFSLSSSDYHGVAVDTTGNVYVAEDHQVLKLSPGANAPSVLPLPDLVSPWGIAVDGAGDIYTANLRRLQEWQPGRSGPVDLPIGANPPAGTYSDDVRPVGVAVDSAGNVYATVEINVTSENEKTISADDKFQVLKLAPGAHAPTRLAFHGLNNPDAIAVGDDGSVYVADRFNNRVLKLERSLWP
jgi:serine/threonine-protein kinase